MYEVPVLIRTSPVYDVSDDDLPPVQASYHLMNPSGLLLIVPDHFTRQQKLFHRVCMEVQDGDEQPLRYGIPGAVRANAPGRENCFSYLKSDETLRVRRDTPKLVRSRQLNSMLRQMRQKSLLCWFGLYSSQDATIDRLEIGRLAF